MEQPDNQQAEAFSAEPIGNPPGGGSWTWTGYRWERQVPEPMPSQQAPAIEPAGAALQSTPAAEE